MSAAHKTIFVNLDEQRMEAYEDGKKVFGSRISSGKEGHETPTGTFKVLQKERIHRSNLWPRPNGGARMPYMLRITWSGVAMHQGYVPNRPASHGCIRVPRRMARRLFKWADIGTPVLVGGGIWHYFDGEKSSVEVIGYTRSGHLRTDHDGYEIVELYD
jgi:lipoprotein-anchoring transpeptidase ErfK/SrfK